VRDALRLGALDFGGPVALDFGHMQRDLVERRRWNTSPPTPRGWPGPNSPCRGPSGA